ncbi:MAG: hypothetical protein EA339_07140 [Rhodobacteraceae bacterium]|nr:MAG: hypothetical protein EA339_07140 [Paracoccaceae bacterium]
MQADFGHGVLVGAVARRKVLSDRKECQKTDRRETQRQMQQGMVQVKVFMSATLDAKRRDCQGQR